MSTAIRRPSPSAIGFALASPRRRLREEALGGGPDARRLGKSHPWSDATTQQPLQRPSSHQWLNDVYAHVSLGQPDAAIDLLFEKVDDLLVAGQFERCNELVKQIDLGQLDTNLVVAVLSITLAAKQHLPDRPGLYHRSESRIRILAPERVENLLRGLC